VCKHPFRPPPHVLACDPLVESEKKIRQFIHIENIICIYTSSSPNRTEGDIITDDPNTMNRQAMGKCEYLEQGVSVLVDPPDALVN
jgi:hypothetical protein